MKSGGPAFWSGRALSLVAASALCALLVGHGITEEVPRGSIEGRAVMAENGKVLANATVILTPLEEGPEGQGRPKIIETGKGGEFRARNIPAGDYTIEASAKAHTLAEMRLTVEEGGPTPVELELKPISPYLDLYASQRVLTPSEQPYLEVHGFLPEDDVGVEVHRIELDTIVEKGGLYNALSSFSRYSESAGANLAKLAKRVQTADLQISNRDAEGTFIEKMQLEALPEGFYWVQVRSGAMRRGAYLSVSRIGLVAKTWGTQALCYVTDLKSGLPVPGASLRIAKPEGLKEAGLTGPEGTLKASVESGDTDRALLVATSGSSHAVVSYSRYDRASGTGGTIFLYTDRPIYRPGDQIHFKGLMRKHEGNRFSLPGALPVDYEVRDTDDTLVKSGTLTCSPRGSFAGVFAVSREAEPGDYRLVVRCGAMEKDLYVPVAAYRKPEYTVKISPLRPYYLLGDVAQAKVKCEYYFGGPVVGAKVKASVYRSPAFRYGLGEEDDADVEYEEYSGGGGEFVAEVDVVTDANGEATVEFDTEASKNEWERHADYEYTVSASVADAGNKFFEGQGSVKVVRGAFALSSNTDRYVVPPSGKVRITIGAFEHGSNRPIAGKQVRITAGTEHWVANEAVFKPGVNLSTETGRDGKAMVDVPAAAPGSMLIRAASTDEHGREVVSDSHVFVEGGPMEATDAKLTVTLDKRGYRIGDQAKVLIQTSSPGGAALVTTEADGVHTSRIVKLKDQSTVLQVPVDDAYAPNAFVSVAYIRDKTFHEASRRLPVDLGKHKLAISITSDKPDYQPGQTATYTISTRDEDGKPVSAELSLAVVDESIYAIREDDTDIVRGFYPRRSNAVQTNYSFPELYLDGGDKSPANIPIRRKFKDTAIWLPFVETDDSGLATVQVTLPDNLTQWRATAVGITDGASVGMASLNVRARKPLMIRLQAPSFLVQGDECQLVAIVSNDTGRDAEVEVQLGGKGVGIGLEGDAFRRVHVRAGKPESVTWKLKPGTSGTTVLTATVKGGGASDAVEQRIEVQPHGRISHDREAGAIQGSARFRMSVRDGADPNYGRLRITLTPSIAASMVQSLDDLIGFPYGCTEQTMSRFLPTVLVAGALKEAGLPAPAQASQIPEMVAEGFARLQKMQHGDGGWGWWEYDESDPFMTALVLDGMHRARQSGFEPNPHVLDQAVKWAESQIGEASWKKMKVRDRVYLCYALVLHGKRDRAAAALAQIDPSLGGASSIALALLAAQELGAGHAEKSARLLEELLARASESATLASWPVEPGSWGVEPSALALAAIAHAQPNHPILQKVVRFLMVSRTAGSWLSTRDTAYALMGLSHYLRQTREIGQEGRIQVSVNGRLVASVAYDAKSYARPDQAVEVPMRDLRPGDNIVEITSSSRGVSYYSADLRQAVVQARLGRVLSGSGLSIERRYYALSARRMEDGTLKLAPSKNPVERVRAGDLVRCELVIRSDRAREFILIEDPIPSACRITEREEPAIDEEWSWWWSRSIVLDDKMAFFARNLPAGASRLAYTLRAESPGVGFALPTVVYNMYDPSDKGSSAESQMEVWR